jgi:hypothetical protein
LTEFNNSLFLETTIQVGRFWGKPKDKDKIVRVLSQFDNLVTSTYVRMEFKRRVIRELIYLYNIVSSVDNFSDIFFRIEGLPPYQLRKIKGFLASFSNFFLYLLKDKKETKVDELLEIGRLYFKNIWEIAWKKFNDNINTIINETDCLNAKYAPKLEDGKIYDRLSCKQINEKCRIIKFFEDNRASVMLHK